MKKERSHMDVTLKADSNFTEYWEFIKDAPKSVKIKLITLLSESLADYPLELDGEFTPLNKKNSLLKQVKGSWKGSETAEELINKIRANRLPKPPVSFNL